MGRVYPLKVLFIILGGTTVSQQAYNAVPTAGQGLPDHPAWMDAPVTSGLLA